MMCWLPDVMMSTNTVSLLVVSSWQAVFLCWVWPADQGMPPDAPFPFAGVVLATFFFLGIAQRLPPGAFCQGSRWCVAGCGWVGACLAVAVAGCRRSGKLEAYQGAGGGGGLHGIALLPNHGMYLVLAVDSTDGGPALSSPRCACSGPPAPRGHLARAP